MATKREPKENFIIYLQMEDGEMFEVKPFRGTMAAADALCAEWNAQDPSGEIAEFGGQYVAFYPPQ